MAEKREFEDALDILSRKWHPRIVEALLSDDEARFNELKKEVDGISNKALSESLKDLNEKNLVEKEEQDSSEVYRLTDKGRSMETVLNSIKRWSNKFSEDSEPEILIVEDEEEQAELYARWLNSQYSVSTANTKAEFYEEFSEEINLVLLDRDLQNTTAGELIEETELLKERPVILITGKEPGEGIIGLNISDYMLKPISKEEIKQKISEVMKIQEKNNKLQKFASLLQKKDILERNNSIYGKDEYEELLEEIEELREEIDEEKIEDLKN
ncbi:MAG: winged helix-turn-helix transcriptional regulator [Candidatus Nanohalobium sp.]